MPTNLTQINDPWTSVDMVLPVNESQNEKLILSLFYQLVFYQVVLPIEMFSFIQMDLFSILDKLKAEKRLRVGVERENRFLEFNQNVTSISQSTEHPIGSDIIRYHPMSQSNCIFQNYHPLPSIQTTSQFPFQFNSDPIGSNNSNIQEIKFK